MFVKIEPSGCMERNGIIQLRLAMYLEPDDYGYNTHYVQVPVIPEDGYLGKTDINGLPVDKELYVKWLSKLPTIGQNNPFHNHFIYVEPDISDKALTDICKAYLQEAYIKWACDGKLDLINPVQKLNVDELLAETRLSQIDYDMEIRA